MSGSRFLDRWSRLKKAADKASTAEITDPESLLANLTPDSDFGQFLRQEIGEEVRRKAMKTLFADPHFNVMDGLDIYIDDYSISEPIPEAMLATLNQARGLLFEAPEEAGPAAETPADRDILAGDGQNVPLAVGGAEPPAENQ
jgi:hypothetical protein